MRRYFFLLFALGAFTACEALDSEKAGFGEECSGPDDCESGICLSDSSGTFENFCSQECDAENTCPDGGACLPTGAGDRCVPLNDGGAGGEVPPAGGEVPPMGGEMPPMGGMGGAGAAVPPPGGMAGAGGAVPPPGGAGGAGGGPAGGQLGCLELVNCFNTCAGDQACLESQCIANGTQDGLALLQSLGTCLESAGCAEGDDACFEAACGAEIQACVGNSTGGGGAGGGGGGGAPPLINAQTCRELYACLVGCNIFELGEACQQSCVSGAAPAASQELQGVLGCFQNSGCAEDDAACFETACGAQQDACIMPAGTGCGSTLDCVDRTGAALNASMNPSDIIPLVECFLDMSDEGSELYSALGECAETNMCEDLSTCDACSAERMSCEGN
ncbi:MAG: hypothetical protein VYD19_06385 [Myxococcota bacterium]|nr:hypothetical protein [Myxococcota bacterium]